MCVGWPLNMFKIHPFVQILCGINGNVVFFCSSTESRSRQKRCLWWNPPDSMFVGPVVEILEMSLKSLSLSLKFPCSSRFDKKIKVSDCFQLDNFPRFAWFHPNFWLIQRGLARLVDIPMARPRLDDGAKGLHLIQRNTWWDLTMKGSRHWRISCEIKKREMLYFQDDKRYIIRRI